MELAVHKFTLTTGKTLVLREPEIADLEFSAQVTGTKAKDNQLHAQVLIQKELFRLLLVEVDGKKLSAIEKERLFSRGDKTFSLVEYSQGLKAVQMITGTDAEVGNPTVEVMVGKSHSGNSTLGVKDMPA